MNNQLRGASSPGELITQAKTVEASRVPSSLLTINGGSASIWFALYDEGDRCGGSWMGKWIAPV